MNSLIEINNLTVRFGDHTALEDITLSIGRGDFLAVVGPNGSGKTTFLKAVLGMVKPRSGEILIEGLPPGRRDWTNFGYVPQLKTLDKGFPARVIDLVVSGLRQSWPSRISPDERERAISALEMVGMAGEYRRPLVELSGGQLQKIYLARSFVRNPAILLLDEPATGIDVVCEGSINEHIEEVNRDRKTTIIMVTHNWATARHHAKTILLVNRRQIYYGPTEKAFEQEKLRQAFIHTGMEENRGHTHV
ncbi:MAG: metal ABC transporter ATP-binding protein [Candidatus Kapaibacterium sp.]